MCRALYSRVWGLRNQPIEIYAGYFWAEIITLFRETRGRARNFVLEFLNVPQRSAAFDQLLLEIELATLRSPISIAPYSTVTFNTRPDSSQRTMAPDFGSWVPLGSWAHGTDLSIIARHRAIEHRRAAAMAGPAEAPHG